MDKPWGETRVSTGSTPTTRRFTGQREDATIGLYYYGARYYDPQLGRFSQADTIVPEPGNPQALNRYSYTLNNPTKYRDASGHCAEMGISPIPCVQVRISPPASGSKSRRWSSSMHRKSFKASNSLATNSQRWWIKQPGPAKRASLHPATLATRLIRVGWIRTTHGSAMHEHRPVSRKVCLTKSALSTSVPMRGLAERFMLLNGVRRLWPRSRLMAPRLVK